MAKYHGGVSARPSTVFEPSTAYWLHSHRPRTPSRARRLPTHTGDVADGHTAALALARLLPLVRPLTVVTNHRLICVGTSTPEERTP